MPKVVIDYEFSDVDLETGEDLDIYVNDKNGSEIGFIKIHVTKNNKIVILTEGQYNDNSNIIFDQWQDSEDYVKKIKEIEEN